MVVRELVGEDGRGGLFFVSCLYVHGLSNVLG